jgi:carboxypeptidase Taq
MSSNSSDTPEAYDDLLEHTKRVSNLREAAGVLSWDQQVTMPEGGATARAGQLSALSAVTHEAATDDRVRAWLGELRDADLSEERQALVREVRREFERDHDVPSDLVERLSRRRSEAQETWREAKAADDFDRFAPALEDLRDLHRERAERIDPDADPYVVMFEDGEPSLDFEVVERIFETLREELVPLVAEVREADESLPRPFEGEGTYDEADQLALCQAALDHLGYDRSRGRLDTAAHPFMSGNQFDARVTTRVDESNPLDALTATIHEFGHAAYQLGLPEDHYATPLGQPRSAGVHESQSRFWENHVGRSRAFWASFAPTFNDHLGTDLDPETLYRAVNRVYPENPIRVEADELTYHMHIILRCEIDRAFVAGDLAVEEIPETWNEKMEAYLGVTPSTDREGCLQDIHWSYGFAGFQNYTVGSVLAAQLDAAVREDLDVDGLVREGEFGPLREWFTEHVHRHGKRYETDELVEAATGEPLTADYFVEHVRETFADLYGL